MLNTIAWCSRTRSANAAALSFTRQPSGLDYVLTNKYDRTASTERILFRRLSSRCTGPSNVSPSFLIQITELLLNFSRNHTHIYGISVSPFELDSSRFAAGDQWLRWFQADRHCPHPSVRSLLP